MNQQRPLIRGILALEDTEHVTLETSNIALTQLFMNLLFAWRRGVTITSREAEAYERDRDKLALMITSLAFNQVEVSQSIKHSTREVTRTFTLEDGVVIAQTEKQEHRQFTQTVTTPRRHLTDLELINIERTLIEESAKKYPSPVAPRDSFQLDHKSSRFFRLCFFNCHRIVSDPQESVSLTEADGRVFNRLVEVKDLALHQGEYSEKQTPQERFLSIISNWEKILYLIHEKIDEYLKEQYPQQEKELLLKYKNAYEKLLKKLEQLCNYQQHVKSLKDIIKDIHALARSSEITTVQQSTGGNSLTISPSTGTNEPADTLNHKDLGLTFVELLWRPPQLKSFFEEINNLLPDLAGQLKLLEPCLEATAQHTLAR